jgi:hypothetical protein
MVGHGRGGRFWIYILVKAKCGRAGIGLPDYGVPLLRGIAAGDTNYEQEYDGGGKFQLYYLLSD